MNSGALHETLLSWSKTPTHHIANGSIPWQEIVAIIPFNLHHLYLVPSVFFYSTDIDGTHLTDENWLLIRRRIWTSPLGIPAPLGCTTTLYLLLRALAFCFITSWFDDFPSVLTTPSLCWQLEGFLRTLATHVKFQSDTKSSYVLIASNFLHAYSVSRPTRSCYTFVSLKFFKPYLLNTITWICIPRLFDD